MANTNPTDFGTDTSCLTGLRTGRYASGIRLVGESLYRRFTTPLGTLKGGDDEANFGLDLLGLIGTVIPNSSVAASLPAQIEAEALKDERIASCVATVTSTTTGPATIWNISIACQSNQGPFTLVLGVSSVTVDLLGVLPGA